MQTNKSGSLPFAGKYLLTDLDGTLLTSSKTIQSCDREAIARFRAGGGQLSVATGRGYDATLPYLEDLQPDFPAILYNGSVLYDWQHRRICHATYLPASAQSILQELSELFPNAGAEILDENGVHIFQNSEQEQTHIALTHVQPDYCALSACSVENCYKALFACTTEDVDRMMEYVKQQPYSDVIFTRSHDWLFEILPKNASKGHGLQRLRALLPPGAIIGASGDFDNDLTMLTEANLCACPSDAQPVIRQAVAAHNGWLGAQTSDTGFFAEWVKQFTKL